MDSTANLKIYLPLGDAIGSNRKALELNIQSIAKWRQQLGLERSCNNCKKHGKVPLVIKRDQPQDPWIVTNSCPPMNWLEDAPKEESLKTDASSPKSSPSSNPSSPAYTTDEYRIFGRIDESGAMDIEVLKERIRTGQILEGKLTPPPDRNYSGMFAESFRRMALEEMKGKHERARALRILRNAYSATAARGCLKGWKFLRHLMLEGLAEADTSGFPAYHPDQRAYLIVVEEKGGRLTAKKVRNLDACSKAELLKLMQQVETRGWRDIIWVANQGEWVPYVFEGGIDAEVMVWGGM
ncbi:hypothetical protein FALBO_4370 [Fusarium albosuccineum]|uniref:Uncharacterized protein n=1 Tax=Fusarium albosuccineum TaxID=1237068 RepID=A0A8H4LG07_9HYPO|nr:hypothetical protein FALBO_4370 [Fusarium albosuccineum]